MYHMVASVLTCDHAISKEGENKGLKLQSRGTFKDAEDLHTDGTPCCMPGRRCNHSGHGRGHGTPIHLLLESVKNELWSAFLGILSVYK